MPATPTRLCRLLTGGLLTAFALPACAQSADDLSKELEALLNTPVTVASKAKESVNDAPGIITVVTRKEIEGFGGRHLGQILNRVVSMNLLSADIWPDHSVVVRGQETTPYNNHILVLMDGRPVRDPISGGMNTGIWRSFPVASLERIEIIRGPGSVLYGSCAYSGVVNLVTRTREGEGMSGHLGVGGGSEGAFRQEGLALFSQGDLKGMVSLQHFKDDGPWYQFRDYNGTWGQNRFYNHDLGAAARFAYKGATLNLFTSNTDPYALNGGEETWEPGGYKIQRLNTHLDAGYAWEMAGGSYSANITHNANQWKAGPLKAIDTTDASSTLVELTGRFQPLKGLNIVAGGGMESSTWKKGLLKDGDQSSQFLYVQGDYTIDRVKLLAGVQYNKIQDVDPNFSPRVGVIAHLTEEIGAKLLYSTAFRKGYPLETSFNHPVFRGNPKLAPELVSTLEAQVFYQGKRASGAVTFFKSHMKDIITRNRVEDPTIKPPLPPFYFVYGNGGTWDSQGVEVEGKASLGYGLFATAAASWQTNERQDGLKDAALHPSYGGKIGLIWQWEALSAGVFDAYHSAPKATTLVNRASKVINPIPEGSHNVSARISWDAWKGGRYGVRLAVEGENLLDLDIRYPDYPNKVVNSLLPLSAGRSMLASVSLSF